MALQDYLISHWVVGLLTDLGLETKEGITVVPLQLLTSAFCLLISDFKKGSSINHYYVHIAPSCSRSYESDKHSGLIAHFDNYINFASDV